MVSIRFPQLMNWGITVLCVAGATIQSSVPANAQPPRFSSEKGKIFAEFNALNAALLKLENQEQISAELAFTLTDFANRDKALQAFREKKNQNHTLQASGQLQRVKSGIRVDLNVTKRNAKGKFNWSQTRILFDQFGFSYRSETDQETGTAEFHGNLNSRKDSHRTVQVPVNKNRQTSILLFGAMNPVFWRLSDPFGAQLTIAKSKSSKQSRTYTLTQAQSGTKYEYKFISLGDVWMPSEISIYRVDLKSKDDRLLLYSKTTFENYEKVQLGGVLPTQIWQGAFAVDDRNLSTVQSLQLSNLVLKERLDTKVRIESGSSWKGLLAPSNPSKEIIFDAKQLTNDETQNRTTILKKMKDADLIWHLNSIIDQQAYSSDPHYEPLILETISRKRMWLHEQLNSILTKLTEQARREDDLPEYIHNLELVAAVRAFEGQSGPLLVQIDEKSISCDAFSLPAVTLKLKNLEKDLSLNFANPVTDREGWNPQLRLTAKDSSGNPLPTKSGERWGGGLSNRKLLAPGQTWRTKLNLDTYFDPPPPGQYKLHVSYHDQEWIANFPKLENLLTFESKSISFEVKPVSVHLKKNEFREINQLIAQLDPKQPATIIAGKYGKSLHKRIAPESTLGKLLQFRLKAVPTMIKALNSKSTGRGQKSQLLALLFNATQANFPDSETLGSLTLLKGQALLPRFQSFKEGELIHKRAGKIDAPAQDSLIKKWTEWNEIYFQQRIEQ